MPKYLGYAHVFYYPDEGGKAYHQGDNIPIGKHEVARLTAMGHKFEGADDPPLETASVAVAPDVDMAVSLAEIAETPAAAPTAPTAPVQPATTPSAVGPPPTPTAPVEPSPPVPAAVVFGRPTQEDDPKRFTRRS